MGTEMSEKTRGGRVLSHFRHNVVGYVALFVAVSMTPIPSYAHGLIGTAQLKDGAVTTAKLHANAVKSGKIADLQVKRADIAGGAINSSKIANGTVAEADLETGAVTAAKLGTIIEVVAASLSTASGATRGVTATCPVGSKLISGGFDGGGNATQWRVQRSHQDGNGWRVFGTNQNAGDSFIEAKAYCLQQ